MNGPSEGGGMLERLRANETLRKLTGGRPDIAIFGLPVVIMVLVVAAIVGVTVAGGSGDGDENVSSDNTPSATKTKAAAPTKTPSGSSGLKTPIAVSPGEQLTLADLALRGAGEPARGPFTGERIIIPKIGVDAPFTFKTVPSDGQMPNPNGPTDVAYYDFSDFPGLGGLPNAGGNVVVAGHVDYINFGPAVFWDLATLTVGDRVQIRMADGTMVEYAIEFNKRITAGDADWSAIVAGTADESITLITCAGQFSNGSYDDRQIAWGRRV